MPAMQYTVGPMSKIDTIEKISDTLARVGISIEPKRCSYIRNWNSRCKQCLSACQHDAIKRSIGRLSIDGELCTECGACAAACPTSTMRTVAPTMTDIVNQTRTLAAENDGHALFTCSRHAEQAGIDPNKVIVVPCLNYLDEYLMTGLFAVNVRDVTLVCPDCEGCNVDCAEPYFDLTVSSVKSVLDCWHIDGSAEIIRDVPEQLRLSGKRKHVTTTVTSDRREAFKQAGGSFMSYLVQAVDDIVGTVTGEPIKHEDKDKQIIVRLDEVFPPDTYRSARMLNMLDYLGTRPYGATIESRFWASVDIDPTKCKYCGACARMCVTRALQYTENEDDTVTLTFQPSLCVACGLCKDSCLSRSMVYSNKVLADDLDRDVVKDLYRDHERPKRNNFI